MGSVGAQNADGMGVKGDGERAQAEEASAGDDLIDDPGVAAMDAVEVADGGDDGAEVGGESGEIREDVHRAVLSGEGQW